MATITLTIVENGVAVPNARVIAGELLQVGVTTDANGRVTRTVPADFAIFSGIAIMVGSTMRGNYGPMLLEAGSNHIFDIARTAPT